MACNNTLIEILKSCNANLGGIVKFYIGNGSAIDRAGVTITNSIITAANLVTGASPFVEYEFNPNTSNYTENSNIDLATGSTFYTGVITLQLTRREATKRQNLLLISSGQPELTIIVKDSNGLYVCFGIDDDKVYLTGNEGGSGQAKGDLNGYTLTFTTESATPAYFTTEAVVEGLL